DGIRDFHVTGVQTCALPIYSRCGQPRPLSAGGGPLWRASPQRYWVPVIAFARRCAVLGALYHRTDGCQGTSELWDIFYAAREDVPTCGRLCGLTLREKKYINPGFHGARGWYNAHAPVGEYARIRKARR